MNLTIAVRLVSRVRWLEAMSGEFNRYGTATMGEKTELSNACEPARKDMQQETAQKLVGGNSHLPLLVATRIVRPTKGEFVAIEVSETGIADCHLMRCSGPDIPEAI